jgi:catechol 2,3-dioxygenase-like lactoylglutathione lyase family enzyme
MKISLSSILVKDQGQALQLYTDILGFEKKEDSSMGEYRWLTVTSADGVEDVELLLEPTGFPPAEKYQHELFDTGIPATSFQTNDIKSEFSRLKARRVVFRGEPKKTGPVTTVLFEDTCGNLICIAQPEV